MASSGTNWPAPAKLNLFLHITGRRDDGYHLLQTVFQFVDFGDRLDFRLRRDGAVHRSGEVPGVPPEQDLVVRAARRLAGQAGREVPGVDIAVEKRLPMGGGLGGGSSDAATTLVALNHLWDLGFDEDRLAHIGLGLGADVPVFVRGRAAWAEGVGEELVPVELPEPWFLVLSPNVTVSTAEVFGSPELTRNSPAITIRDFLAGQGGNVFEPVVRAAYPEVSRALDWLSQRAPARLTGTGGCVFAWFDDELIARTVLSELPPEWSGFVARGRNRSPLLERLARRTGEVLEQAQQ